VDRTQVGRAGELALALYALVTSDGELELFTPVSDDDHVDITAGRKGGIPALAIQVKTGPRLDANGMVEANAFFDHGHVREHPAFLYAILLMRSVAIETAWIVPSPDFNRLAYRIVRDGRDALEFRAYPDRADRWAPYRVDPLVLGPHLLSVIDSLEQRIPSDFLNTLRGVVVASRISES
jgi:hypothetical protein